MEGRYNKANTRTRKKRITYLGRGQHPTQAGRNIKLKKKSMQIRLPETFQTKNRLTKEDGKLRKGANPVRTRQKKKSRV